MRKLFIALAASLLVTLGYATSIAQLQPRSLNLGSGDVQQYKDNIDSRQASRPQWDSQRHDKHQDWENDQEDQEWEDDKEGQEWDDEEDHHQKKNAQGVLGLLEGTVNIGDKVAQTLDPAVPTINLSNKGDVVTLKVAGKLAQADSQWNIRGAMKKASSSVPNLPKINLPSIPNQVNLNSVSSSVPNLPKINLPSIPNQVNLNSMLGRAQTESEGIINALENVANSAKVNLAVSDKVGQPPVVNGAVSFKLAETQNEGIINALENVADSAKVNLAVSDKVGQPPVVKGAISFKLAQDRA